MTVSDCDAATKPGPARPAPEPQPAEKPRAAPGLSDQQRAALTASAVLEADEWQDAIVADAFAAVRREALEEAARLAEDYEWALPMTDSSQINEATDDAACEVCRQVAAAIRKLAGG